MDITIEKLENCNYGNCLKIPKKYKINTDGIETLEDVKQIISALEIHFYEYSELNKLPDKLKIKLTD